MQAEGTATNSEISRIISLLNAMPGAALAYDGDSLAFYFNARAAKWFGVKKFDRPIPSEVLAFELARLDEQYPITLAKTPWQRAWNGEIIEALELVLSCKGQAQRVILCESKLVEGISQQAGKVVITTMSDISPLREEFRHIAREHMQLSMILEGTEAGTWLWNIQTGEVQFNERWAQIAGYTLTELSPTSIDTWLSLAHPDDLARAEQVLNQHLSGEIAHYSAVCRMRHKDGHWVWIHDRGHVYQWDSDGKPLWMAGTHLDISSIRSTEEDARASHAYIQAIVDSSSDVAIIATDTQGLITIFNPGAERLLGYSETEMVGKLTPETFHLGEEIIARGMELSAEEGKDITGFDVFVYNARRDRTETRRWTYVCKSGEHRQVSLSVGTLRDEQHNVIGFLGMAIDLSAQLAAEEQARLAAQRFAGAFNSTAVGMALVSLEGRWMAVNDAICQMLGYTRDELLLTDFQTVSYPEDLENDLAQLQQLLAGEIPHYQMQKRYYRKNGQLIYAKLWVALVRDRSGDPLHFVSQVQNNTDEYFARQALQSSEARLRGLFNLSPVGISLMDYRSGRTLEVNDASIAPSGYTREEFLAKTDRELTPPEYAPLTQTAIEQLRTTGRFGPIEKEYIRKDGTRYPILVQGILMKDSTGNEVVWSLAEDISERKRLDRIKNEFVSTVSHELRTPLTSISGALALIVGGVLGEVSDDILAMLKIAASSSQRLHALVDDLLDMDKLLAGKMELKVQTQHLVPLLDEAISSMNTFALNHGVAIQRGSDIPVQIDVDGDRLIQILTNLLSNACKHSRAGEHVTLQHTQGPQSSVILSVIDQGTGIPPEFKTRIFQKFAQADTTDASEKKGTGLGLAICKELVDRMGGVMGYESQLDNGSHFWIRLPSAKIRMTLDRQTPRVLLVEGDKKLAKLVSLQVANRICLDLANNHTQAREKIAQQRYDLMLLDLGILNIEGETLLESLLLEQYEVPIVILSGYEIPAALAGNITAVIDQHDNKLPAILSILQTLLEPGEN